MVDVGRLGKDDDGVGHGSAVVMVVLIDFGPYSKNQKQMLIIVIYHQKCVREARRMFADTTGIAIVTVEGGDGIDKVGVSPSLQGVNEEVREDGEVDKAIHQYHVRYNIMAIITQK